jgi:thioesterase domain-containing protein
MEPTMGSPELKDLLRDIEARGIQISLWPKSLRYRAPRGRIDNGIKDRLELLKDEVSAFLLSQPTYSFPTAALGIAGVDTSCVLPISIGGSGPKLFGTPSATGAAAFYRNLVPGLRKNCSVYGLRAVGFDFSRAPLLTFEEMGEYYAGQIRLIQEQGPYHLCGYSIGGLIALETARALSRSGEIGLLALLDTRLRGRPPHSRPAAILSDPPKAVWLRFARLYTDATEASALKANAAFWKLSRSDRLDYLLPAAKRINSMKRFNADSTSSDLAAQFEQFCALMHAEEVYELKPFWHDITYFAPEEETDDAHREPWLRLARARFTVVSTPGDHVSMLLDEKNAIVLGRKIDKLLGEDHVGTAHAIASN